MQVRGARLDTSTSRYRSVPRFRIALAIAWLGSPFPTAFSAAPLVLLAPRALLAQVSSVAAPSHSRSLSYPAARRSSQVDDYHGVSVADPYRWLENLDAPETHEWVAAENALTAQFLSTSTARAAIRERLTQLWNYPKYGAPMREGGRLFFFENSGLQDQSVLYVQDRADAEPRALLDPNGMSTDGTVALSAVAASSDGRYLAYGLSASGSDWQEFHVRDVATGADLSDTLRWIKFSGIAWTKDSRGFFYSRYDQAAARSAAGTGALFGHKVYYHRIGRRQSEDQLIYERDEHSDWLFNTTVSDDGRYAVIDIRQGADERNRLYFIDLDNPRRPRISAPVVRLFDEPDASYEFVSSAGAIFYVRTTKSAPRGRLVAVDINDADEDKWRNVVRESLDAMIGATQIDDRFIVHYLRDAHSQLRLFGLNGTPRGDVVLPTLGTVNEITGKTQDRDFFFTFTSFLSPTTVFRYDLESRTNSAYREPYLDADLSLYETKEVFFTSKDGTQVPMFVTAKKGLRTDGSNPALLYSYGGFNVPMTPSFSPVNLAWLERGGILAVPCIRGGGEYGKAWHEAGMLNRKQNVFDDFIAAAEYLIREGYTSPPRLAIAGGSNGGLLVGAAMTQRPELFGAALPAVGVLDMLRYHRFTVGWAWVPEYGSSDDPVQFRTLLAYSPLHNVREGTRYPATLITTADHDDRVVPVHSFKFAAAVQAAQTLGGPPVLIRIDVKAGHGAGKPTSKQIDEAADRLAFLTKVLEAGAAGH
jgi:prolyl oligopeptidase